MPLPDTINLMAGKPSHRKTCRRYDVAGQAHCLTFSCFKQQPFLSKPRACRWCLQALQLGRDKGMYDLWAYVIMPEHMHVVLLPRDDVSISQVLTTIKQSSSKRALNWVKRNTPAFLDRMADIQPNGARHHRFWLRGGGYDRNLRTVEDVHEKIRYIHANPVRRGLVARPEDWPWSSCAAWDTGEDELVGLDRNSLPPLIT